MTIARDRFDAALFDMDGVVTRTAETHAAAWKQLFDEYRNERIARGLPSYAPFDIDSDYRHYVDGRARYDGVAAFFASRGIVLADGQPSDDPTVETVCGLGNRKEQYFWERVSFDAHQHPRRQRRIKERRRTAFGPGGRHQLSSTLLIESYRTTRTAHVLRLPVWDVRRLALIDLLCAISPARAPRAAA